VATFPSLTSFDFFPALPIGITKLTGQDNKTFLQGQLTCDLDLLSTQQSALGAHCDAKGKTLAILRLLQSQDDVLALQATENVESHLPSLKKYAVFSKVDISDASNLYHCTGLSGDAALAWANGLTEQPLTEQQDTLSSEFGLITSYPLLATGVPRLLIVSNEQQHQALSQILASNQDAKAQDSHQWFALDMLSGSPQITPSLQGEFVPQMLNMQMIEGISFKKGCYIGQETIARLHYRGQNKRAMFILSAASHIACNVGDSLERQIGESWRNAGTIVSVWSDGQRSIACAILATDIELDSNIRVKGDESATSFSLSQPSYFTAK